MGEHGNPRAALWADGSVGSSGGGIGTCCATLVAAQSSRSRMKLPAKLPGTSVCARRFRQQQNAVDCAIRAWCVRFGGPVYTYVGHFCTLVTAHAQQRSDRTQIAAAICVQ